MTTVTLPTLCSGFQNLAIRMNGLSQAVGYTIGVQSEAYIVLKAVADTFQTISAACYVAVEADALLCQVQTALKEILSQITDMSGYVAPFFQNFANVIYGWTLYIRDYGMSFFNQGERVQTSVCDAFGDGEVQALCYTANV